ncbi:RNA exonuclease 4 [Topomyia yanbarensis]|uniref:RNA exonuclease 4 n=1 Tax=Topomyia yanbarensis TaxID=2498891 RepID=UPI00273A9E97|nr:RNA exonuclease 4 [Topomyia yanbarensis]
MVNKMEPESEHADIENILGLKKLTINEKGLNKMINKSRPRPKIFYSELTESLALDCEFVGIGSAGKEHMLARVSVVNERCDVILDTYVKPQKTVIDYRTEISGIRPDLMESGQDYGQVRETVKLMLSGRILVGHALKNDLYVLNLRHPRHMVRDTSRFKPIARRIRSLGTPSLKNLSKLILGEEIQTGIHDSIQDARAAMKIYLTFQDEWEKSLRKTTQRHR